MTAIVIAGRGAIPIIAPGRRHGTSPGRGVVRVIRPGGSEQCRISHPAGTRKTSDPGPHMISPAADLILERRGPQRAAVVGIRRIEDASAEGEDGGQRTVPWTSASTR